MPKDLILNNYYRENLSSSSKLVYGMLLDRMQLSKKNEWVNEDNEIFLLYTKKDIAEKLDVSERTIYNSFDELENVDLIEQERQGLNKPNKIFIGRTKADKVAKENSKSDMKRPSGQEHKKSSGQNMNEMQGSETKCIETDCNDTKNNTYIDPHQKASQEGSDAMFIFLNLFQRYIEGKHGNIKRSTYLDVEAKLSEYYLEQDEEEFIRKLREYFEDFNYETEGLPKLSYFYEVSDRFFK